MEVVSEVDWMSTPFVEYTVSEGLLLLIFLVLILWFFLYLLGR